MRQLCILAAFDVIWDKEKPLELEPTTASSVRMSSHGLNLRKRCGPWTGKIERCSADTCCYPYKAKQIDSGGITHNELVHGKRAVRRYPRHLFLGYFKTFKISR